MNSENYIFNKYIKRIRARMLFQNKNWLAIICGETGSGKSYSALSLAKLIGNNVHVVFNPIEFMYLLNNKNKLNKGDVVVFDEAGVGLSSRDWQSQQNKLMGSILQTFRNMNVAVIFTTPNLSFIDVQARKLFHTYIDTSYIDYKNEEAFLKVYDIQVNSRLNKVYFKNPKFETPNGSIVTMTHLVVDKPDDDVIEYYEGRKSTYTEQLNANALKDMIEPKGVNKLKEVNLDEVQKEVVKNKDKYLKTYKGREFINLDLLKEKHGLSINQAKLVKGKIENEIFN